MIVAVESEVSYRKMYVDHDTFDPDIVYVGLTDPAGGIFVSREALELALRRNDEQADQD